MSAGNALAGVSALLSSFGVQPVDVRDQVDAAFAAAAAQRNVEADVTELRFGTLSVQTGAFDAQVLRFEADKIVAELQDAAPGAVSRLAVKVRGVRSSRVRED